jgi:hypothetical protein
MTDSNAGEIDHDSLMQRMFEFIFRSFIEDGSIEIINKAPQEIVAEFKRPLAICTTLPNLEKLTSLRL